MLLQSGNAINYKEFSKHHAKATLSREATSNQALANPLCYCLNVTRSIIIRNSQSQFTIRFCIKHINHSLLSCLITVSP